MTREGFREVGSGGGFLPIGGGGPFVFFKPAAAPRGGIGGPRPGKMGMAGADGAASAGGFGAAKVGTWGAE